MKKALGRDTRRDPHGHAEAAAQMVFAIAEHRRVSRHDERIIAGGMNPIDQRIDARLVSGKVALEPDIGIAAFDVLELDQR